MHLNNYQQQWGVVCRNDLVTFLLHNILFNLTIWYFLVFRHVLFVKSLLCHISRIIHFIEVTEVIQILK